MKAASGVAPNTAPPVRERETSVVEGGRPGSDRDALTLICVAVRPPGVC